MPDEIEKSEQPSPDDVLATIMSFNDPALIAGIFKEKGWTYSFEIQEWITMAKQNANLSVKAKALIQLRKLVREAAETSGLIANVSQTMPNAQGGHTTFSAKRISGILNPVKKIESTEIKETQNAKSKETRTESNRGSDRGQSETTGEIEPSRPPKSSTGYKKRSDTERGNRETQLRNDTGRAFPLGDADSGGTESPDGGETSGRLPSDRERVPTTDGGNPENSDSEESNPCIKTRPPTCDQDLFPGISSAED